jgi:hypothetical protein
MFLWNSQNLILPKNLLFSKQNVRDLIFFLSESFPVCNNRLQHTPTPTLLLIFTSDSKQHFFGVEWRVPFVYWRQKSSSSSHQPDGSCCLFFFSIRMSPTHSSLFIFWSYREKRRQRLFRSVIINLMNIFSLIANNHSLVHVSDC